MIQAYVTAMKNNVEARREFDELSTQLKSAGDDTALKVRLIQQKAVIDQLDAECRDITNKLAMVVD